jgi:opacity protein-like surface antigen
MMTRIHVGGQIPRFIRNLLEAAVILVIGLLLMLPELARAENDSDPDPFDRPGFYIGGGATYQFNAFSGRIEDLIEDELKDIDPASNPDFDLDESFGANVLLGYRVWSWFALELQYEWVDEYDIKGSVDIPNPLSPPIRLSGKLYSIEGHTLTANTKWIIPFWRIQPYLLLGGGVAMSDVSKGSLADTFTGLGADIDDGTHLKPAARAGLGLDLYITEHIVINAQASAVLTTLKNPDIGDIDDLNYMSFAAGLQYRF